MSELAPPADPADPAEQTITLTSPHQPQHTITIRRDGFGVAHLAAQDERDAFFGQGFAAAQDRLWQMEYDRLRAQGRWSEAVGPAGVVGDRLARRLDLAHSAQVDVGAMSPETRAAFEAYAAGVNAFIHAGQLPPEYALTGIEPEPWEPWHSCAAFKIRHVLMGVWQKKLVQAQLLTRIGADAYAQLDGRPPIGSAVILPPSGGYATLFEQSLTELDQAAEQLGFLAASEGGSNSWAVHGTRTTTGKPVLCNDSHRALDVPSVYWQVHVACPAFDAIGATFPGLPGFPHFGHNPWVAWNITHTSADYQDLYIEQFDQQDPVRYRTPEGWAHADRRIELIQVAGSEPVEVEVWRTRHGSIVHGDPHTGTAIALRYTATDAPNQAWECLLPMLRARSVAALFETQRQWVDPVNNLVAADVHGSIGYLTRGYLPIRSSSAHRQFPASGWTGEHEWIGRVPFEQLPQAINPEEGFIVTANQAVIPGDEPFISHDFSAPSRAERIRELIQSDAQHTPATIIAWQGDTTSRPARTWSAWLARSGPYEGDAEAARQLLAAWDGTLLPGSAPALLYGYFRRTLARALFTPIVGHNTYEWLISATDTTSHAIITRWMATVVAAIEQALEHPSEQAEQLGQAGRSGEGANRWAGAVARALPDVLPAAWGKAASAAGSDPTRWRWGDRHYTAAQHPLVARFLDQAETLNPPSVPLGGDGDTIQASSYLWRDVAEFPIVGLSVYRQAVDLTAIKDASFIIPGGVSGVPQSPHWQDQLEHWRTHQRIPMHFSESDVCAAATRALHLSAREREDAPG